MLELRREAFGQLSPRESVSRRPPCKHPYPAALPRTHYLSISPSHTVSLPRFHEIRVSLSQPVTRFGTVGEVFRSVPPRGRLKDRERKSLVLTRPLEKFPNIAVGDFLDWPDTSASSLNPFVPDYFLPSNLLASAVCICLSRHCSFSRLWSTHGTCTVHSIGRHPNVRPSTSPVSISLRLIKPIVYVCHRGNLPIYLLYAPAGVARHSELIELFRRIPRPGVSSPPRWRGKDTTMALPARPGRSEGRRRREGLVFPS